MKLLSPAKINLTLNVGPLRADGFHYLTSIFHTIELYDELEIIESDEFELIVSKDLGIDAEHNLALRAARMFVETFDIDKKYKLILTKNIPHGAGLGGGSSNAAAVLFGLASLNGFETEDVIIQKLATDLGSDVPVFLQGSPANCMTGRGEQLKKSLPGIGGLPLVVAMHPDSHSPTKYVYKAFDEDPQPTRDDSLMIAALKTQQPANIARELYNNLSQAARKVDGLAGEVENYLVTHPASLGAQISGSGAASFALCETEADAEILAQDCRSKGYRAEATRFSFAGVSTVDEET